MDVSRDFVSNAVAQAIDRTDPVEDVILNTHIVGTGRTTGTVGAALLSNDDAGEIDLVTTGSTVASTVGYNGPVQLYSDSVVPFQIHQRVVIRPEGVAAGCPQACAQSNSTLRCITTDFKHVVDRVVKNIAYKQYWKNKDEAEYIAARHAEDRLNRSAQTEAQPRLRDLDDNLKKKQADLKDKGVTLVAVHFSSSPQTLLVRALVGSAALDVGAAPPLAQPAYVTLRLHGSAVNETAQTNLAGKTYTGEDLEKEAKKLGWEEKPMPKDDKDFSITFAKDKPLTVTFADHGFQAVMRLAEFTSGEDVYDGADMTVIYKFVGDADKVKAVRQGPIEAFPPGFKKGQKLGARAQAMRTVLQKRFGKFFKEEIVLKNIELAKDARQAGPLVPERADGDRGWLVVAWRKGP
jgi:hypothetical protein